MSDTHLSSRQAAAEREPVAALPASGTIERPHLPTLTLVIPVLNEDGSIERLVARLVPALDATGTRWSVLFVDDGSRDGTLGRLREVARRDPRFAAISFSRNFGKEVAVAAGLSYVGTDIAVLMDADLQHPPELIGEFMARWREGYDIVYGTRTDRSADSRLRRLSSRLFYSTFHSLSGTPLPEGAGDFRLLDRKAVEAMNRLRERVRFNKGLYSWIGFRSIGVPFDVPPRTDGRSRFRPRQLLHFALDGLASFTTIPLRVWSYLGLGVSLFAFFYAAVFLFKTIVYGADVPGLPTLVISIMLFSGVQLISLGVIGEYLGRMYEEVKGRPLFIVAEEIGVPARPRAGSEAEGESKPPVATAR